MSEESPRLPLARFKVLDITRARAGPTAVRHLADWGAQVIRIEQPSESEDADPAAGARHGFDFQNLHRNKRAMTLDLKSEVGKAIFMELVKEADVILENMRSQVKFRLGIDYESVRKVNPGIVYGSISGFGQDGPYGPRPGVDQIAQGMGGLMSITGLPGQGPVRVGIPIADLTAGGFLAQGVLIALLDREVTGVGRWVTTSLLEAQIAMLDFQAARWLIAGEVAQQAGNDHPTGIPTGLFPTKDSQINIAASGQNLWDRFCKAAGLENLLTDPRFEKPPLRSRNRHELNAIIAETTKTRISEDWILSLNDAGVPCGPVNTIDQTFADPQVQHLRMARPMEHPALGEINVVAQPNNISGYQKDIRIATPDLGQQTDDILRELGKTDAEIAALRDARVV
jgi:crotonobetainyl-CoA:carnitine CoA-transferase CaiB-like acyl-CoA transferase